MAKKTPALSEVLQNMAPGTLTEDQASAVIAEGISSEDDFQLITPEILAKHGVGAIAIQKLIRAIKPAEPASVGEEITSEPTEKQINDFAHATGMDPNMLNMFMFSSMMGSGVEPIMDFTNMVPLPTILDGYNPKIKNMHYMFLGKIESSLGGGPIIVIDEDGKINKELTIRYVTELQEGREPADDDTYFGDDGTPHELIGVGVDAQSIYDIDPLGDAGRTLPETQVGKGNVPWKGIPLDVRQLVFFAAKHTNEVSLENRATMTFLRQIIKIGVTRHQVGREMPNALKMWNQANRDGSLPTLRASRTSTNPRRPSIMPNRRTHNPRTYANGNGPFPQES